MQGGKREKTNDRMSHACVCVCVCVCRGVVGGGGCSSFPSLESVLIKKDWFYSKCAPRGQQTCSERKAARGGGGRVLCFPTHPEVTELWTEPSEFHKTQIQSLKKTQYVHTCVCVCVCVRVCVCVCVCV